MVRPERETREAVVGEAPSPPGRTSADHSMVYREDDASFKKRLRENLVNHTLLNTFATLIIFILIFYVLTRDIIEGIVTGVIAGLLVLVVSNFTNILWRIQDFERWEIFSNGVKLGYDPQGKLKFLKFSEIEGLEVRRGLGGKAFVIHTGSRHLRYRYKDNRDVFDLMLRKYEAFQAIRRSPPKTPT